MTDPEVDRGRVLVEELLGTTCRCGKGKKSMRTFCATCYYALPPPARRLLYQRLGEGYAEAYDAAVALLDGGSTDAP